MPFQNVDSDTDEPQPGPSKRAKLIKFFDFEYLFPISPSGDGDELSTSCANKSSSISTSDRSSPGYLLLQDQVCQDFNIICRRLLNRGFLMIERKHALSLKTVKAQLPRRESERRCHPLARHCDILTSIETRISMLNMTYSKFIENGLCCFIPGRVIDEIRRVLRIVDNSQTPPRAHEVLQELRDISSMAIEHFDDKISPAFKKQLQRGIINGNHSQGGPLIEHDLLSLKRRSLMNAKLSCCLASQYCKIFKKVVFYKKTMDKQRLIIKKLMRKQNSQHSAIVDLKRRIEECDIKYTELTRTNQAVGAKGIVASTSRTEDMSPNAQPLRHFASQIKLDLSVLPIGTSKRNTAGKSYPNMKPRKPVINLPSLSSEDGIEEPRQNQQQQAAIDDVTASTSKQGKDNNAPGNTKSSGLPYTRLGKRSFSVGALDIRLISNIDSSKKQKLDNMKPAT